MPRTRVMSSKAAAPGGSYSHGIEANGFLFTAGFGPKSPTTGEVVGTTVGEQTRQTLDNLAAVLAERGLDFSHVVKVTSHLQNLLEDFAEYDAVYREYFVEPYPARTTVGSQLAHILVEIDVVAVLE